MKKVHTGPKVLLLDIETAPIEARVWDLWDQNIALNQILKDWNIIAWAAKWQHEDKIHYQDLRGKNPRKDKKLLKQIWQLIDSADIIVTQNGKKFDAKKLNARFVINGFQPPSTYKHIDTRQIAKRHFGFTSASLEYMCNTLNLRYKKLKHKKFPGMELWNECLNDNAEAWKEMEVYNKHDVLALSALYDRLYPWDNSVNFNLYKDTIKPSCNCGGKEFVRNGYFYTASAKYQRFKCTACGSETRSKQNLFSKEKRQSLRSNTSK